MSDDVFINTLPEVQCPWRVFVITFSMTLITQYIKYRNIFNDFDILAIPILLQKEIVGGKVGVEMLTLLVRVAQEA